MDLERFGEVFINTDAIHEKVSPPFSRTNAHLFPTREPWPTKL